MNDTTNNVSEQAPETVPGPETETSEPAAASDPQHSADTPASNPTPQTHPPAANTLREGMRRVLATRPEPRMVMLLGAAAALVVVIMSRTGGISGVMSFSLLIGVVCGAWIPSALSMRDPAFWKILGVLVGLFSLLSFALAPFAV